MLARGAPMVYIKHIAAKRSDGQQGIDQQPTRNLKN
jgi:hypothetical protein